MQRNYSTVRKQEESYHFGICKQRLQTRHVPCPWRKLKVNTSPEGYEILWDEFHKCLGKWPNQSHLIVTLSRGKSRFRRPGAFTFLSERARNSLIKGILTEYFFRMKKVTTHNNFFNGKYHKSHKMYKKLTFVTSWCTALILSLQLFVFILDHLSLHTTAIPKSIFRGRFTKKQTKLQLQGPSFPWVPCKALYQFCIFFNSHHKRKKNYNVFITVYVTLPDYIPERKELSFTRLQWEPNFLLRTEDCTNFPY